MTPPGGIEIGTVRKDEFNEALELQGKVFGLPADYFRTLANKDPLFDYENVFVARSDGRIVSHVQVFPKVMRTAGVRVWMAGIGGVATDPAHRGRGLASDLLKMSIGSMMRRGMETSILFTGIHDFYRKLGWETVSGMNSYRIPTEKDLEEVPGYDGREFTHDDLGPVSAIYETQNSTRDCSVVRSEEVWKLQLKFPQAPSPVEDSGGFMVAEKEDRVVAYTRLGNSVWMGCTIIEGGCLPGHEAGLQTCLAKSVQRARVTGHKELSVFMPEDHPLATVFLKVGAERTREEGGGMMLKIVKPSELMIRLEDPLSARLGTSQFSRTKVELQVGDEVMSLEMSGGFVAMGQERGLSEFYRVDERGFARIVSGYSLPSELVRSGSAKSSDAALRAMDRLFPKHFPHIYIPDEF
jgi:predicted acetyltransferase